jgi:hypothetical protein
MQIDFDGIRKFLDQIEQVQKEAQVDIGSKKGEVAATGW